MMMTIDLQVSLSSQLLSDDKLEARVKFMADWEGGCGCVTSIKIIKEEDVEEEETDRLHLEAMSVTAGVYIF